MGRSRSGRPRPGSDSWAVDGIVARALAEDRWTQDVTTRALGIGIAQVRGVVRVQAPGVVSGMTAVRAVARRASLRLTVLHDDGERVRAGDAILTVSGPAGRVLGVERTLLNLLMHLSGVATATARAVRAARPLRVYATRKTTPGLRDLEKAAVVHGGGRPHRRDLSSQALVKNNHLSLGPLGWAVGQVRRRVGPRGHVQVEVRTLPQAKLAILSGADQVLIDNAPPEKARQIVRGLERAGLRSRVWVELSGGITPENVARYRRTGADAVSIGALTHSAKALPFHLQLVRPVWGKRTSRGR